MKTFFILFLCLLTYSISNAQNAELIGTWKIIEFDISNDANSDGKTKDKSVEDGSVWDLVFMDEGKFTQTSNMSGTGTLDSQEGTWSASDHNLTLTLQMRGRTIKLIYKYELKENALTLERSNPGETMNMFAKFEKKES